MSASVAPFRLAVCRFLSAKFPTRSEPKVSHKYASELIVASLIASAAFAPQVMAESCKMKISFQNNYETKIKVIKIERDQKRVENFTPSIQVMAGQRYSTKRQRQLGNGVTQHSIFSGPQSQSLLRVHYEVWEPQNNHWVGKVDYYARTCRPGKNLFFPLPHADGSVGFWRDE